MTDRLLRNLRSTAAALAAAVALSAVLAEETASAQINVTPPELRGVDIVERPDNRLPLEAKFTDDAGREVALGDYFKGERPVILQLGYNRCPMLCNLVLNGVFDGLKGVDWVPGEKFELLSVSVDPGESTGLARAKKEAYLADFERPGASLGVHFLTGAAEQSKAVADAVGFSYRLQEDGEYAHAAAIFLITPDGRVSRYMYGTRFEPSDLRMALLEASEGRIGTTLDRFILWCHVYDPNASGYVLQARRIMTIGGFVTVVALAAGLAMFWRADFKRRRSAAAAPAVAN